jgi:hypothetical protein
MYRQNRVYDIREFLDYIYFYYLCIRICISLIVNGKISFTCEIQLVHYILGNGIEVVSEHMRV